MISRKKFIIYFFIFIGGKLFRCKKYLREHIDCVHHDRKDYKCDQCGRAFSQSGTLKTHIRCVHEGQKDHHCHLCGRQFGILGALKRHLDSHQGIKRLKCKFCEQPFSSFTGRKKHMRKMHPTQYVDPCSSRGRYRPPANSTHVDTVG